MLAVVLSFGQESLTSLPGRNYIPPPMPRIWSWSSEKSLHTEHTMVLGPCIGMQIEICANPQVVCTNKAPKQSETEGCLCFDPILGQLSCADFSLRLGF